MMETGIQYNKKAMIGWIATIVVSVAIYLICGGLGYEKAMFLAITVFAILLIAMELVDTAAIGILLPLGYSILKITDSATAFSGFASSSTWVFCSIFLISAIMTRIGLMNRIAYKIMAITGGTYKGIVIGLVLTGIALGFLLSGNGNMVLIFIAAGVCKSLGIKGKSAMGLMFISWYGGTKAGGIFFNPALFGAMLKISGQQIDIGYLSYAVHMLPTYLWGFVVIAVIYFLTKDDNEVFAAGKNYFKHRYDELGPMTREEKRTTIILICALVYMMTNSLHHLGLDWGYMLALIALYLPVIGTAKKEDVKAAPWDMILFIGACLSIGTVATSLGFSELIAQHITPMVSGMGATGFLAAALLLTAALNFLLTPMALMFLLPIPLVAVGASLGVPALPILYMIFQGMGMVLLPYEAGHALLMYSFGYVKLKDFVVLNLVAWIMVVPFVVFVAFNYWRMIGIL